MSNLTEHGVTNDIRTSPFRTLRHGFVWHFSSRKRQRRFERDAEKREAWVNDALSRRFKCCVYLPMLACIQLYQQIEQGAFYVTCNGTEYDNGLSMLVMQDYEMMGVD